MATFIKGDLIVLYIHDGAAYMPLACLTSNSLSQTVNIIDSQTKCDPGVTLRDPGSMSYEISAEGRYIDTTSVGSPDANKASHDKLKADYVDTGAVVTWKMNTGLVDDPDYFGTGIISALEMTADAGDELASFSATISGSGQIVTTDPEA